MEGATASSASVLSLIVPEQFRPSKTYAFPNRKFGSKGEERSCKAAWFDKYDWLHYDATTDAVFCHLCMSAEFEKKFLTSTKRDPAFISKGFTYWKDATSAFNKHLASCCHREALASLRVRSETRDVGELLSTQHKQEKATNRAMLQKVLENLCSLARQGLALRGHGDGEDSNFIQLLQLRALDCPEVNTWMKRKTNKYTSPVIQNECLHMIYA